MSCVGERFGAGAGGAVALGAGVLAVVPEKPNMAEKPPNAELDGRAASPVATDSAAADSVLRRFRIGDVGEDAGRALVAALAGLADGGAS